VPRDITEKIISRKGSIGVNSVKLIIYHLKNLNMANKTLTTQIFRIEHDEYNYLIEFYNTGIKLKKMKGKKIIEKFTMGRDEAKILKDIFRDTNHIFSYQNFNSDLPF